MNVNADGTMSVSEHFDAMDRMMDLVEHYRADNRTWKSLWHKSEGELDEARRRVAFLERLCLDNGIDPDGEE